METKKKIRVLFSPLSGSDPIRGGFDGPLMHICRYYKPDIIYLYLSKEMCINHNHDNRYVQAIEELGEILNHKFTWEVFADPELENVHEYDYFYQKFGQLIEKIRKEHENAEMYINISSGTPAMKGALQVLDSLSEDERFLIQVDTPKGAMNDELGKDEYCFEREWENNKDNSGNGINRCHKLEQNKFILELKKNMIRQHIENYDYVAAEIILETIPENENSWAKQLIKGAKNRLKLDYEEFLMCMENTPYFNRLDSLDDEFYSVKEYLLWLNIKIHNEEYMDFIKGFSPVLLNIFKKVLKKQAFFEVESITNNQGGIERLNIKKISANEGVSKAFDNNIRDGKVKEEPLNSNHLLWIGSELLGKKTEVLKRMQQARAVEVDARHFAMHEVVAVTDEWIKKTTGMTASKILDLLRKLLIDAGGNMTQSDWDAYNVMNGWIKKALSNSEKESPIFI